MGPTGLELLAAEDPGLEVLGDSGYRSGATRAALHAAGHTQTIKPIPLQSAVPGGFTIHDFRIDRQAGMVRCPAGQVAPITGSGQVSFARHCQGGPLRRRCTTAKGDRTIRLHPHEDELRAARRRAVTYSFQASYRRWRPMVERSIAWLVADGCRRVPTGGPSATRCGGRCGWPRLTCAGCWCLALPAATAPGCWPEAGGDDPAIMSSVALRRRSGTFPRSCRGTCHGNYLLTGASIFSRLLGLAESCPGGSWAVTRCRRPAFSHQGRQCAKPALGLRLPCCASVPTTLREEACDGPFS
jgi:Transposase DDE domain